jgi:hypothetical protein
MRTLPVPQSAARPTFLQCAADTRNKDLRLRLEQSVDGIMAAADTYLDAAGSRTWYELSHSIQKLPATDEELRELYPRTMSGLGRAGRSVYDAIFNSSPNGICPLCGQGKVFTLDHYLPRSRYAHFAILPTNLVPSCRDCNFAKREQFPSAMAEQTFHPYFDHVEAERWLFCGVIVQGGVSLNYYVDPPAAWPIVKAERAVKHFQIFKLREAFATYAASELATLKFRLRLLYDCGGAQMVSDDLALEAMSSRQANLNSWKTAAYETLAQSDEFCGGGFEQIAI